MTYPTIKEQYHEHEEFADHLMCDVITSIINIPGVHEAVLVEAAKRNYYVRHFAPELVGDIAFQYVWDRLMNPGEYDHPYKEEQK